MKAVAPGVDFPKLEHEVLADWEREQTFREQNRRRLGCPEFTFYDGPPFANGLPHYGHLLANTIKDTVPRYWAMRGYYVERRFGWDCHGVPVEFEIEKREGIKGVSDIMKMGVARFNEECRKSVQHYTGEWRKTITRLGRWVDWDNQYRTMDKEFMESVWWVFKQLYDKGLVYRDFKVVPYSPRITAVLSNFEANQNYKEVQDPAITVKFRLTDEDAFLLAWTTTPWTLISNLALCVGPKITYVKLKDKETGEIYYLAEARVPHVYKKKKEGEDFEILERLPAEKLTGRRYVPILPYFQDHPNAFRVLADNYVSTDDGTGIVHQAPAYGEDDFRVCKAAGITPVDPIDAEGKFMGQIPEYAGTFCKDADKDIIRRLKDEGKLLRHESIVHSYPFCERTDTPLIYKAIHTWYVRVEAVKERLIANNQKINWVPSHIKDGRMGKWLENARDWAISRNRFWGTPLPIWVSEEDDSVREVVGSVAELEQRAGKKVDDLHIHYIDELTWKCKKTGATMRRVPEVFDCWFESGSMPYAQIHYPFENAERFPQRFPADFIAEGLDQTRGWFYTLSVLSTALFDQPAFKNCIVNGLVLAEDGKKMSKRLKNYTPPDELLERFGADSVRLYMLNSPVLKAGNLCFTDEGVRDTTRAVLLPLWNALSFLSIYAETEGWKPNVELTSKAPASDHVLDRWLVSRFQTLARRVKDRMESYELHAVVPLVLEFIDELTNWYIRLSRRRFWRTGEEARGGDEAFCTLYYVLHQFTKVFAPFAPFVSERIYRVLTEGLPNLPESVHLCDMPEPNPNLVDESLEAGMEHLRLATNLGRSLRNKHKLKTRQPLKRLTVITRRPEDAAFIEANKDLVKGELNVKEVAFSTEETRYVALTLKPNLKALGPRLGKALGDVRKALEGISVSQESVTDLLAKLETQGRVEVAGHALTEEDFLIDRGPKDEQTVVASERGVTVLLDTALDEELIAEGLAREVVNRVQKLRKDSGLQVTDRIRLELFAEGDLAKALTAHRDYVARETLAQEVAVKTGKGSSTLAHKASHDIDGHACEIGLAVV